MTKAHFVPMEYRGRCQAEFELTAVERATWDIGEISDVDAARYNCNWAARNLLRFHPNAPDWVRVWSGPFEIYVFNE